MHLNPINRTAKSAFPAVAFQRGESSRSPIRMVGSSGPTAPKMTQGAKVLIPLMLCKAPTANDPFPIMYELSRADNASTCNLMGSPPSCCKITGARTVRSIHVACPDGPLFMTKRALNDAAMIPRIVRQFRTSARLCRAADQVGTANDRHPTAFTAAFPGRTLTRYPRSRHDGEFSKDMPNCIRSRSTHKRLFSPLERSAGKYQEF
jgi:hypothetical protein